MEDKYRERNHNWVGVQQKREYMNGRQRLPNEGSGNNNTNTCQIRNEYFMNEDGSTMSANDAGKSAKNSLKKTQ